MHRHLSDHNGEQVTGQQEEHVSMDLQCDSPALIHYLFQQNDLSRQDSIKLRQRACIARPEDTHDLKREAVKSPTM